MLGVLAQTLSPSCREPLSFVTVSSWREERVKLGVQGPWCFRVNRWRALNGVIYQLIDPIIKGICIT
jgi:hypothetical protein